MNNVAAGIITGEEADEVFYGVVQSASRNLIDEDNSADVLQTVKVLCTDGLAREVNVDKSLNFPTGWLVEVRVSPEGESVEKIDERSVSGTVNENATAFGQVVRQAAPVQPDAEAVTAHLPAVARDGTEMFPWMHL